MLCCSRPITLLPIPALYLSPHSHHPELAVNSFLSRLLDKIEPAVPSTALMIIGQGQNSGVAHSYVPNGLKVGRSFKMAWSG